ncbi:MAG: hypothetical protein EBX50_20200, partial [Chitinophagia bacterium]|nr:hypothetical protein [Chitinophagia bacterium]
MHNRAYKFLFTNVSDCFNWKAYLYYNPDVRAAGIRTWYSAAKHYDEIGFNEERKCAFPGFSPEHYLAANADLSDAFGDDTDLATQHYIDYVLSGKEKRLLVVGTAIEEVGGKVAINVSSNSKLASAASTADSLKQGSISATAGTVPKFIPSLGIKPKGFDSTGTSEGDLKYALSTSHVHFQSFFNDHHVVTANGISDDIISLPCFDEGLYCSLVKEMHRYSLTEISNNHAELAKNNAGLGAMVGSFIGIISGNIFAPFLGHSYGKNLTDRGKPIEEFLPDPNLLFYQDDNSYLSWSRAQVNSPRLRRIIFNRQLSEDGKVYFRLMPAIVTADSVFPIQLFKVNDSTYFYRPLAAGIDRNQLNYDTIRIQKKYFHLRGEGTIEKTDFEID